ncbi:hypothetical protein ACJX0J_036806 [Zea mays]
MKLDMNWCLNSAQYKMLRAYSAFFIKKGTSTTSNAENIGSVRCHTGGVDVAASHGPEQWGNLGLTLGAIAGVLFASCLENCNAMSVCFVWGSVYSSVVDLEGTYLPCAIIFSFLPSSFFSEVLNTAAPQFLISTRLAHLATSRVSHWSKCPTFIPIPLAGYALLRYNQLLLIILILLILPINC